MRDFKPEIQWVPTDSIIPYERNAKAHSQDQIDHVANQIHSVGWTQPIGVDANNVIVIGHCRHLAAGKLGLTEVPVIRLSHLSEDEVMAYRIADNRVAEAPWNLDLLRFDLNALKGRGLDLKLTGFAEADIGDFLQTGFMPDDAFGPQKLGTEFAEGRGGSAPQEGQDDAPPVSTEPPKTQRGDLYRLGKHILICGDCTSLSDLEQLMQGQKADMVITDPPYNINYGASKNPKWGTKWNGTHEDGAIINDNMSREEFRAFCQSFAKSLESATEGCLYIFGPPGADGRVMFTVLDETFHCSTTIIWNKDRFTLGRGKYQNKYEPCWFGWVKDGAAFTDDRTLSNVWDITRPSSNDLHPTMKPVELIETAISHASQKGGTVLDIFGGSGTTMIACEKLDRRCLMMEIDPHYCDVIVTRWETFTGQKAEYVQWTPSP